jgi:hypothetical protein
MAEKTRDGVWRERIRGTFVVAAAVLASALATISCLDVSSVTQFAKASQDVGNNFKSIADQTLATCKWAHNFFPAGTEPLDCTKYEGIEPQLTAVNDALFAYIASLGKLAAPVSGTNPYSSVGADLKKADSSISSQDQTLASAAGGLFGALSQVALRGYQEQRLQEITRSTDKDVQSTVAFLSGYAAHESGEIIRNTWTLEHEFCVGQPQATPGEPLAVKLLAIKCDEDETSEQAKLQAIASYQNALKIIAETHAKLASDRKWTTEDLVKLLVPQVSQLNVASLTMQKATR